MEEIIIPDTFGYFGAFPTIRCPLRCSYCNNLQGQEDLDRNNFKELSGTEWIYNLNRFNTSLPITLEGGEPGIHSDFIEIINGLKPSLNIHLLTNLQWSKKTIERFLNEVNPTQLRGHPKYPAIRASYHPEQMGDGEGLVEKILTLQNKGFSIGMEVVNFPDPLTNDAIDQMGIRARNANISLRVKKFLGKYKGEIYGVFKTYPDSIYQDKTRKCLCKTSDFLVGPNGNVYRCHSDLYSQRDSTGNISNPNFKIENIFRPCTNYGNCHPCDVKDKSNSNQELGHTSVEIKFP